MESIVDDLTFPIANPPLEVAASKDTAVLEVSILMPCLNEAETIVGCVQEALTALREAGVTGEVVVSDNGSRDGSQELARQAGARVVDERRKGYGNALIGGIGAAYGTYVLMGDADGSYNFRELPKFLQKLRAGDDLVMGSRLPAGGGKIEERAMPWSHRIIGNPGLTWLGHLFFGSKVSDFYCGLRAFRREAILSLSLRSTGMEFALEMVVKATTLGLKVGEVPITLRPDGRSRAPHLRTYRDGWRSLRFFLLYSPRWLFLYPGIGLLILGLLGILLTLPGTFYLGNVGFDTSTMLICGVAVIVGFQIVMSYVFVKAYAANAGLLPDDKKVKRLLEANTVEWGIVIGLVILVIGFGLLIYALLEWQAANFGPLSYPRSLRIVIPGVTCIALGTQSIFSGFILAILGIKHR